MKKGTDNRIKSLIEQGISDKTFSGALLLVAQGGKKIFFQEAGQVLSGPDAWPVKKDTIFDLASLTKVLATMPAMMWLIDHEKAELDQPLSEILTPIQHTDKEKITLRHLLSHTSGFADWKPFYLELQRHRPFERKRALRDLLVNEPLAYVPGTDFIYSDLGFMLLEWVIEELAGESLDQFVKSIIFNPLNLNRTFFYKNMEQPGFAKNEFAATERCAWRGHLLQGEVHDENASAVGGFSGHSGLFGTAEETFNIVNLLRTHYLGQRKDYFKPGTVKKFCRTQGLVNGCTRALGWDTPSSQGSSAGRYFSPNSVGHLGFTGTSIWMDLEKDVIAILLTNRIHPTRENKKIRAFRPMIHDTVMEELGLDK